MEKLDSKIIILNNEKYLVYLKKVKVKEGKNGRADIVRAFVKKVNHY